MLVDEQDLLDIGESIENATMFKDKYFAMVGVFHQLHCVDLIRKYLFREYYPTYSAFEDSEATVLEHVGMLHLAMCRSPDGLT